MQESGPKPTESHWLLHCIAFVFRFAIIVPFLTASFGILEFLRNVEPIYNGNGPAILQASHDSIYTAVYVAKFTLLPLTVIFLIGECEMFTYASTGHRLLLETFFLPLLSGLMCGVLAWVLFADEGRPEATMLISGGVLVGYMGSSLHVVLAHLFPEYRTQDGSAPIAWYVVFVLIASTFMGGLIGWKGPKRNLKEIIEYRDSHWANKETKRIDAEPYEPDFP